MDFASQLIVWLKVKMVSIQKKLCFKFGYDWMQIVWKLNFHRWNDAAAYTPAASAYTPAAAAYTLTMP